MSNYERQNLGVPGYTAMRYPEIYTPEVRASIEREFGEDCWEDGRTPAEREADLEEADKP
jgi:hypothetical protein